MSGPCALRLRLLLPFLLSLLPPLLLPSLLPCCCCSSRQQRAGIPAVANAAPSLTQPTAALPTAGKACLPCRASSAGWCMRWLHSMGWPPTAAGRSLGATLSCSRCQGPASQRACCQGDWMNFSCSDGVAWAAGAGRGACWALLQPALRCAQPSSTAVANSSLPLLPFYLRFCPPALRCPQGGPHCAC